MDKTLEELKAGLDTKKMELARRLVELAGGVDMMVRQMKATMDVFYRSMQEDLPYGDVASLTRAINKFMVLADQRSDEMLEMTVRNTADLYTIAELAAAIEFYGSLHGKSYLAKAEQELNMGRRSGEEWSKKLLKEAGLDT